MPEVPVLAITRVVPKKWVSQLTEDLPPGHLLLMCQVTVLLLRLCFLKRLVAAAAKQGVGYSLKLHHFIVCC